MLFKEFDKPTSCSTEDVMIDYDHVSILTASFVPSDWLRRRVATRIWTK